MGLALPELNRHVIANLETGRRDSVSVDELFVLARALGVAPIHLLVPVDDYSLFIQPTPGETIRIDAAREWIAGDRPIGSTPPAYWSEAPDGWRDRRIELHRRIEARAARAVWTAVERATGDDGIVNADVLEKELANALGPRNGNGGR